LPGRSSLSDNFFEGVGIIIRHSAGNLCSKLGVQLFFWKPDYSLNVRDALAYNVAFELGLDVLCSAHSVK
jgi:hypothetical protein